MASKLLFQSSNVGEQQPRFGEDGIDNRWEYAVLVRHSCQPNGLEFVSRYIEIFQDNEIEHLVQALDNIAQVSMVPSKTRMQFLQMLVYSSKSRLKVLKHVMANGLLATFSQLERHIVHMAVGNVESVDERLELHRLAVVSLASADVELGGCALQFAIALWSTPKMVSNGCLDTFFGLQWSVPMTFHTCDTLMQVMPTCFAKQHWVQLRKKVSSCIHHPSTNLKAVVQSCIFAMLHVEHDESMAWFEVIREANNTERQGNQKSSNVNIHDVIVNEFASRPSLMLSALSVYETHWQLARAKRDGNELKTRVTIADFALLLALADSEPRDATQVCEEPLCEFPLLAIHQTRTELASSLAGHVLLVLGMELRNSDNHKITTVEWCSHTHMTNMVTLLTDTYLKTESSWQSSQWRVARLVKLLFQWCQVYARSHPYTRIERGPKVHWTPTTSSIVCDSTKPYRAPPDLIIRYHKSLLRFLMSVGEEGLLNIFNMVDDDAVRGVIVRHTLKSIGSNAILRKRSVEIHATRGSVQPDVEGDEGDIVQSNHILSVTTECLMNLYKSLLPRHGSFVATMFQTELCHTLDTVMSNGTRGLAMDLFLATLPILNYNKDLETSLLSTLSEFAKSPLPLVRQVAFACCASLLCDDVNRTVTQQSRMQLLHDALGPLLNNAQQLSSTALMDTCDLVTRLCRSIQPYCNQPAQLLQVAYQQLHILLLSLFGGSKTLEFSVSSCFAQSGLNTEFTSVAESIGHLLVTLFECEQWISKFPESGGVVLSPNSDTISTYLEGIALCGSKSSQLLGLRQPEKNFMSDAVQVPLSGRICLLMRIVHGLIELECRKQRLEYHNKTGRCLCASLGDPSAYLRTSCTKSHQAPRALESTPSKATPSLSLDSDVKSKKSSKQKSTSATNQSNETSSALMRNQSKLSNLCSIRSILIVTWNSLPLSSQLRHSESSRSSSWFSPLPIISVCTASSLISRYSARELTQSTSTGSGSLDSLQVAFDALNTYLVMWGEDEMVYECGVGEAIHQVGLFRSSRRCEYSSVREHVVGLTGGLSASRTLRAEQAKLDVGVVLLILLCRAMDMHTPGTLVKVSPAGIDPKPESCLRALPVRKARNSRITIIQSDIDDGNDSSDFEPTPRNKKRAKTRTSKRSKSKDAMLSDEDFDVKVAYDEESEDDLSDTVLSETQHMVRNFQANWVQYLPQKYITVLEKDLPICVKNAIIPDVMYPRFDVMRKEALDLLYSSLRDISEHWGVHQVENLLLNLFEESLIQNSSYASWTNRILEKFTKQNVKDLQFSAKESQDELVAIGLNRIPVSCSGFLAAVLTLRLESELSPNLTVRALRGFSNCIYELAYVSEQSHHRISWSSNQFVPLKFQLMLRKYRISSPLAIRRLVKCALSGEWSQALLFAKEIVSQFSRWSECKQKPNTTTPIEQVTEEIGQYLHHFDANVTQTETCANNAFSEVITLLDTLSQCHNLVSGLEKGDGYGPTVAPYQVFCEAVALATEMWDTKLLRHANATVRSKMQLMSTHLYAAGSQAASLLAKGLTSLEGDGLKMLAELWPSEYKRLNFSASEMDSIQRASEKQSSNSEPVDTTKETELVVDFNMGHGGTTEINFGASVEDSTQEQTAHNVPCGENEKVDTVIGSDPRWSGLSQLLEMSIAIREWVLEGNVKNTRKGKLAKFIQTASEFEHRFERSLARLLRRVKQQLRRADEEDTFKVEHGVLLGIDSENKEQLLRVYLIPRVGEQVSSCEISTTTVLQLLRACDNFREYVDDWQESLEHVEANGTVPPKSSRRRKAKVQNMNWVFKTKKRKKQYTHKMNRAASSNPYITVALEDEESGSDSFEDLEDFIVCNDSPNVQVENNQTRPLNLRSSAPKPVSARKNGKARRVTVENISKVEASGEGAVKMAAGTMIDDSSATRQGNAESNNIGVKRLIPRRVKLQQPPMESSALRDGSKHPKPTVSLFNGKPLVRTTLEGMKAIDDALETDSSSDSDYNPDEE